MQSAGIYGVWCPRTRAGPALQKYLTAYLSGLPLSALVAKKANKLLEIPRISLLGSWGHAADDGDGGQWAARALEAPGGLDSLLQWDTSSVMCATLLKAEGAFSSGMRAWPALGLAGRGCTWDSFGIRRQHAWKLRPQRRQRQRLNGWLVMGNLWSWLL